MTIPWLGEYASETIALKRSFDLVLGKMIQPTASTERDLQVAYFNSASVQWHGVESNPDRRMWASPTEIRNLAVRTGDLLICEGGDVGRSAIYNGPPGSIFQNSVHRARSYQGSDIRYLKYLLTSLYHSEWLDVLCNKATIAHLTVDKLGAVEIPQIAVDEQCQIADFLDGETARIDGLVAARQRMRDLLALKRERMVEQILGLDAAPPMVPLKYEVQSVSVGIVITPANWYVDSGGVTALRGLNVRSGHIDTSDIVQISHAGHRENMKSRLLAGDVVVVRTGQAGTSAVVPEELDGCNCIDLLIIRPGRSTSSSFLSHYLNSFYARDKITEYSVGSIQSHFNVGSMKNLGFPLIEPKEQERRASALDEVAGDLDLLDLQLETQLALLGERRQALITAAVTGQIDVTAAHGLDSDGGITV